MLEPILTYEVKQLLNKIKTEIVKIYPIQVISLSYFLYAVMGNKTSSVKIWLEDNAPKEFMNAFNILINDRITKDTMSSVMQNEASVKFSEDYDEIADAIYSVNNTPITSEGMFLTIISNDSEYTRLFLNYGLSLDDIINGLHNKNSDKTEPQNIHKRKSKVKKKKEAPENTSTFKDSQNNTKRIIPEENNIVEANCTNLVRIASNGEYDHIIGLDNVVDRIFDIITKCDRKCVAIVGERGVGKTSAVKRLARRLYTQDCPKQFNDRYVMMFEEQISNIITDEMDRNGKYIGFIDGLEKLFLSKDIEAQNTFILKQLFSLKNTPIIITMDDASYAKNIESKPDLSRYLQKIVISEPCGEELYDIIRSNALRYEMYHNVYYSDDLVDTSVRLAKRYILNDKAPMSVLNILDAAGAYARIRAKDSDELIDLKSQMEEVVKSKNEIKNSGNSEDYDRKDMLIRKEIELKNAIQHIECDEPTIDITESDVKAVLSDMINVPVSDMDEDDKKKLRNLKSNLSSVVIGQDSVIDDICKAVRRQRVGLSNPNRPCSMLFCGNTGVGKTFIAKRLAYEMFGDENNMIRLDMSEYGEKTSVTKLYGSSPGYIGYEEGGVLTEAIKKKNRCVLLLDEIEKAHSDIYNVFLQVFDEGRLTDNKGTTVSFKDVIIIMTSNIGATDVSLNSNKIGFVKTVTNEENNNLILKAIKRNFKPEFINRIDNICYFNKLTDDNIRQIIINEVEKVHKKVIDLGYDLDDSILHGKLIDDIFDAVKSESEYGARPVIREVQRQIEDRLTDYIIDNDVEKGFVFKFDDIYNY